MHLYYLTYLPLEMLTLKGRKEGKIEMGRKTELERYM